MDRPSLLILASLAAVSAGACHPGPRESGGPPPTETALERQAEPSRSPPPRPAMPAAAEVARCSAFPTELVAGRCALGADAGAPSAVGCVELAPVTAPRLPLITIAVYEGSSRFPEDTHLPPRMADQADAGPMLQRLYADFEGPTPLPVAPGRVARMEGRSFMLGGALQWATLRSAGGGHELVLAVQQLPHDYPVSQAQRQALRELPWAQALLCLEKALWPAAR